MKTFNGSVTYFNEGEGTILKNGTKENFKFNEKSLEGFDGVRPGMEVTVEMKTPKSVGVVRPRVFEGFSTPKSNSTEVESVSGTQALVFLALVSGLIWGFMQVF